MHSKTRFLIIPQVVYKKFTGDLPLDLPPHIKMHFKISKI